MPSKMKKVLKLSAAEMFVKMTDQTSPKFAHNAIQANKTVVWTYEFWLSSDAGNRGSFELETDLDVCKKKDEKAQSVHMNNAAIALVEKHYPDYK
jgi:hypothetical protein